MKNKRAFIKGLLDCINEQLGTRMKFDYAPHYGGYLLYDVPAEFSRLRMTSRVKYSEFCWLLMGLMQGISIGQDLAAKKVNND